MKKKNMDKLWFSGKGPEKESCWNIYVDIRSACSGTAPLALAIVHREQWVRQGTIVVLGARCGMK